METADTLIDAKYLGTSPEKKGKNRYISYSYVYRLWLEWGAAYPLMTDHIRFVDTVVHDICVKWWDRDGDRQLFKLGIGVTALIAESHRQLCFQ